MGRSLGFAVAAVFSLGVLAPAASGATFSSSAAITITDGSSATPYPSAINVTGVTGPVLGVRATLTNMSETFPNDVDILLVGPSGAKTFLISDVCSSGATPISGVTFVFDDAAPSFLPTAEGNQCVSGVYKPTDFADGTGSDTFPAPAPAGPYGATLSVFNGLDPNGTWQLWVRDDVGIGGTGTIPGWSLEISTPAPPAPPVTKKKKCKKKHHGRHKAAIAKKKKCKKHHK